jgi:hypothetical protein
VAGGPHAQVVPCPQCGARATRQYEGVEDDHYRCERGHDFGIDWSHGGPPQEAQWPPPADFISLDELAERHRFPPRK